MPFRDLATSSDPNARRFFLVLTEARSRHGITPTALAKLAGVTPSAVNKKINGTDTSNIKTSTVAKLEKALSQLNGGFDPEEAEGGLMQLNKANEDLARAIEALIGAMLRRGVLAKEDLPAELVGSLERRRALIEKLGLDAFDPV